MLSNMFSILLEQESFHLVLAYGLVSKELHWDVNHCPPLN